MDVATHQESHEALRRAITRVGSQSAMGRLVGKSQAAVWRWVSQRLLLPAEHVLVVERETGISRHELRPDIYGEGPSPTAAVLPEHGYQSVAADPADPVRLGEFVR